MEYYDQGLIIKALKEAVEKAKSEKTSLTASKFSYIKIQEIPLGDTGLFTPSGTYKLAETNSINPNFPLEIVTTPGMEGLIEDQRKKYQTISCPDRKTLTEILYDATEIIDRLHEKAIKKNLENEPNKSSIQFYKLVGLNGSQYKVYDFIGSIQEKKLPEKHYECHVTVGNFPILYQSTPIPSEIEKKGLKETSKFAEDFLFEKTVENPHRKARSQERKNYSETQKSVFFRKVYTISPTETKAYHLPRSVLNERGGFNMLSRADSARTSNYILLSPQAITEEIIDLLNTKELKIGIENIANTSEEIKQTMEELIEIPEKHFKSNNKATIEKEWENLLKKINELTYEKNKDLCFSFSKKTRIQKYLIDKNAVYYAKTPIPQKLKKGQNDETLKPFPYTDHKKVKGMIRQVEGAIDTRKKRKDINRENKSVKLHLQKRRESKNLGNVIKKTLIHSQHQGRDYPATTATAAALKHDSRIYEKYIEYSNPGHILINTPFKMRTKQEWCHLISYKDSGNNEAYNLVAGSFHANTEQCAIEGAIRSFEHYKQVTVKLTAYLHPNQDEYKHDAINAIPPAKIKDENITLQSVISIFTSKNQDTDISSKWPNRQDLYNLIIYFIPSRGDYMDAVYLNLISKEINKINLKEKTTTLEVLSFYEEMRKTNGEFTKNSPYYIIYKCLRSIFHELCEKFYYSAPVAAFIRYVIFVDDIKTIDYVVDAQREEFNEHEFKLTHQMILSELKHKIKKTENHKDDDAEESHKRQAASIEPESSKKVKKNKRP